MQKVLFSKDLISIMMQGKNLLNRADIKVFTAATTDDVLKIHIEETLNLIVTTLDLPGTRCEAIFDIIWQSQKLKKVLVIMICEDNVPDRTRCKQCGAKYSLAMPVDPGQLHEKVRQFLNVAQRQAYRVILKASVEGKFKDRPFLCFTENISSTGALIRAEMDLSPGTASCALFICQTGLMSIRRVKWCGCRNRLVPTRPSMGSDIQTSRRRARQKSRRLFKRTGRKK